MESASQESVCLGNSDPEQCKVEQKLQSKLTSLKSIIKFLFNQNNILLQCIYENILDIYYLYRYDGCERKNLSVWKVCQNIVIILNVISH